MIIDEIDEIDEIEDLEDEDFKILDTICQRHNATPRQPNPSRATTRHGVHRATVRGGEGTFD